MSILASCKKNFREIFIRPEYNNKPVDGLRAIAILYVLIFHSFFFTQYAFVEKQEFLSFINSLPSILRWVWQGDKGVDIFFVISGFLIGQHLMREFERNQSVNMKRFYLKRAARIIPLYILAIAIYGSTGRGNAEYFWANLLFINNFLPAEKMFIPWSWSLTIEGQFYLLAPFVIYLLYKTKTYFLPMVGLFFLANLIRYFLLASDPAIYTNTLLDLILSEDYKTALRYMETVYINLYTRMGPIILGLLAAYIDTYKRESAIAWCAKYSTLQDVVVLSMLALLVVITSLQVYVPSSSSLYNETLHLFYSSVGRNLFSLAITILMLGAFYQSGFLSGMVSRFLSSRVWFPISQTSYAIYLFHVPFIFLSFYLIKGEEKLHVMQLHEVISIAALALFFVFIFGILTFVFLERPLMKIGKPTIKPE